MKKVNSLKLLNKEIVKVHFKSVNDFKERICLLWQNQKENEAYEFSFESDEVEGAFNEFLWNICRKIDNK